MHVRTVYSRSEILVLYFISSSSQTAGTVGATQVPDNCNLPASSNPQATGTTQCLVSIVAIFIAALGAVAFTAGIVLIVIALVLIRSAKKEKHYVQ